MTPDVENVRIVEIYQRHKLSDTKYALIDVTSSTLYMRGSVSTSNSVDCRTNRARMIRGVDHYGTGGHVPPIFGLGGHYHECPPEYF